MIIGDRISLRGLELDDAKAILNHFNDFEFRQYLGLAIPISKEQEEEWIRNTWESRRKGTEFQFGIELLAKQLLIGACGLFSVNWINRSAELGIAIWNKKYWGQRIGKEALRLLLRYGFDYLNLHSIFLRVNENNPRAIAAYERVGFQHSARHRDAIFQEGNFKDTLLMDILEGEFRRRYSFPSPNKSEG